MNTSRISNNFTYRDVGHILNDCNIVKYAAYRTAAKLNVLQRILNMQHVRLGLIAGVFERHRLQATENGIALEECELEALLSDIFFAAKRETNCQFDVDLMTELMMTILLNIYDREKKKIVHVMQAKVALILLSSARLQEKFQYYFMQLADHNNCISRTKLKSLLRHLVQITEYLSESLTYGCNLISGTLETCFQKSCGTLGVTEDIFIGWLLREPQLLMWLFTFHRVQAAEIVTHSVKCRACKMYPITGLRYRCLYCLQYNQCQNCFFTGKVSKKHKLKHPMQEYCREITSKETTHVFIKMLKHKFGRTSKLQHLPDQPYDQHIQNRSNHNEDACQLHIKRNCLLDDLELSTQTLLHGSRITVYPQQELQSVITHLEAENRLLQQEIARLCDHEGIAQVEECLQDHRAQIEAQIERLKLLKHYLVQIHPLHDECAGSYAPQESTPLVSANGRHRLRTGLGLDNISPIVMENSEGHRWVKPVSPPVHQSYSTLANSGLPTLSEVTGDDLSTWFGAGLCSGGLSSLLHDSQQHSKQKLVELQEDVDSILEKLQLLLVSSFSLEESFNGVDNTELQQVATEMESLLTELIDGVEKQKRLSQSGSHTPF